MTKIMHDERRERERSRAALMSVRCLFFGFVSGPKNIFCTTLSM